MDLKHYRHIVALCANRATYFIIYLSYALRFLSGHLPKKRNLEINLLQVYKGGPNFKENWLYSYVSLINNRSQSYAKFLLSMHQYIPE